MEEKPSLGESRKIQIGDLVQWKHWSNDGWFPIIGIVTSIYTKKMSGRRVTMVKVTTIVKVMKKFLKNLCYTAFGVNLSLLGLAVYLSDLNLLFLSGSSAVLTLFGATFVFSED